MEHVQAKTNFNWCCYDLGRPVLANIKVGKSYAQEYQVAYQQVFDRISFLLLISLQNLTKQGL